MTGTTDRVAAELAAIRRNPLVAADGWNDDDAVNLGAAVPRLLAALDAVLECHPVVPSIRLVPCPEHEHWAGPLVGDNDNLAVRRACPDCQVLDDSWCGTCANDGRFQDWPCLTVQAISRALLGTEEGSDGDRS